MPGAPLPGCPKAGMKKRSIYLIVCAVLLGGLIAACSRTAARPAAPTLPPPGEERIAIETVEVNQAVSVRLSGTASLPAGGCLQTGLWIDDQPAGWWPSDVCIEPAAGAWEMVVGLGHDETPAQLDPQARYEVRAWQQGQPEQILASRVFQID